MSRGTLDPAQSLKLSCTGLSPSLAGFPKAIPLAILNLKCSPNPWMHAPRFGLFRFRSPLLPESMFLSLPPAPDLRSLTLPASVTRRTVLQKVRGPSYIDVPQLVNTGFQVLFHSPPGVLFTFPSQYYALSVTK